MWNSYSIRQKFEHLRIFNEVSVAVCHPLCFAFTQLYDFIHTADSVVKLLVRFA